MNLYQKLISKIVTEFNIVDEKNIKILERINTGFSGAEIYSVELKPPSLYTGTYYLKIDEQDEEFFRHSLSKKFSFAAKYINSAEIDGYYVLLTQVAGNSSIEYKALNDLQATKSQELIPRIIHCMLEESFNKQTFCPEEITFSEICEKNLENKLSVGGGIERTLRKHLENPSTPTISLQSYVLPNAFYYAKNKLKIGRFYNLSVPSHGDFHGDNIFLSLKEQKFAVIDWALAREDGFLFLDDAYMELSLLLRTTGDIPLSEWADIVNSICQESWHDLNIKVNKIIENIYKAENEWIHCTNDSSFSHVDKMRYGQYIARVLAGLNFAGKKKLSGDLQEKAFIFSCLFLKKLFEIAQYEKWHQTQTQRWNLLDNSVQTPSDFREMQALASDCAQFSGQYQYILICGSKLISSEQTAEYLARIPWTGIISLSYIVNETLYAKINEVKLLRNLLSNQTSAERENNIQHSAVWWLFANGVEFAPDTLSYKFSQWRNKNTHFLQETIAKICSTFSPQDLKLIIDCGSFASSDEWEKAARILEFFDQNGDIAIEAASLNISGSSELNIEDLENITLQEYAVDMETLAYYSSNYLGSIRKTKIWLPHVDKKFGIQLEADDEKYITSYLEIIGDHLLDRNASFESKHSFYWGETISWDAIDEEIQINRPEIDYCQKKIEKSMRDENWGHINLEHTPGSGATVLSKTICWRLRKSYPVVQIKQLGSDVFESLKRISNCTGMPILILMDGDFTNGDVERAEAALRADLVKFVILYVHRIYRFNEVRSANKDSFSSDVLSILDSKTAEKFESHYRQEIELNKNYLEKSLEIRKNNLRYLTTDLSLAEFRLPFFYGMYAFEDDFTSISEYVNRILERMNDDTKFCKVVSYISIITYFTAAHGLSSKIARKILNMTSESSNSTLKHLNHKIPNFVYEVNNTYRICHPVIARKILICHYGNSELSLSTVKFSRLCEEFIQNIREIDGGVEPSEYANKLITDIFITRGVIDNSDNHKEAVKNSFASIILEVDNENLQKGIFSCLVKSFPGNPHCFQHYGRLLISSTPSELAEAREKFDKAIELDGANPLHFHARGTMYLKHCRYLIESKYKDATVSPKDIYNGCKQIVELALCDFEKAVQLATTNNKKSQEYSSFQISYPYSSILATCTMVIRAIMNKYSQKYNIDEFWQSETEMVRWCRELLAIANRYDFKTEHEYPEVLQNDFYQTAKNKLIGIKFSLEDLQKLIERNQNEVALKVIYLGKFGTYRDAFKKKSQSELITIYKYCEEVIENLNMDPGVLWKWFNAYILVDNFDYTHALGFLESLPDIENNLTANYLLYLLYFCRFYTKSNYDDVSNALKYLNDCKELSSNNPHRVSSRCFLTNSGTVPLTNSKDSADKFPCTIIEEVTRDQAAEMTLDMAKQFKVFFVPYHNREIKMGQGFNQPVNSIIGFSYSGLRGFELELRNQRTPKENSDITQNSTTQNM